MGKVRRILSIVRKIVEMCFRTLEKLCKYFDKFQSFFGLSFFLRKFLSVNFWKLVGKFYKIFEFIQNFSFFNEPLEAHNGMVR